MNTKTKLTAVLVALAFAAVGSTAFGADAKANWDQHCAKCHGAEGKGDTKMGQKMGIKDYSDAKVQAAITDDAAFKAIKEGVKENGKQVMKPFAQKLSDADIQALVAHIRSFKK